MPSRIADGARLAEPTVLAGTTAYRGDIDGLRAVSILLVVAFHAGLAPFSGGYVGVDVFFVLSGFLITGLLVREWEQEGRICLREFYARRIRRLLPLSALALLFTVMAGLWVLPPLQRPRLLLDAIASSLYLANWRFAGQSTAYSDAEVTESLLLHHWSLAIEEQFYLVWPVLVVVVLLIALKLRARRPTVVLAVVLGLVTVASLAASVRLSPYLGPEAYYVTHTRVWELSAGGLVALTLPLLRAVPAWVARIGAPLGLAAIVWAALSYDALTTYPGIAAAVPVVGTVLLLIGGAGADTPLRRTLSLPAMRKLGKWSYAWYLWHWPMIGIALLLDQRLGQPFGRPLMTLAAVVASLGMAALSHRLVEQPIRHATRLVRSRARSFAVGAALTATPVLVALSLWAVVDTGDRIVVASPAAIPVTETSDERRVDSAGSATSGDEDSTEVDGSGAAVDGPDVPEPAPVLTMSPREAADDVVTMQPRGCHNVHEETGTEPDCALGDPDGDVTIALVGDSHAQHWLPALHRAGQEAGWRVVTWTMSACGVADVPIWDGNRSRRFHECEDWNAYVQRRLQAEGDVDLVLIGRAYGYENRVLDGDGQRVGAEDMSELWEEGSARTFAAILAVAGRVAILEETPRPVEDVPTCLSAAGGDLRACDLPHEVGVGLDARLVAAEAAAAARFDPGAVTHLDTTTLVCPDDPCRMVDPDGVILFRDSHHLTQTFSTSLAPGIRQAIEERLELR